jgi:hypothetical protein
MNTVWLVLKLCFWGSAVQRGCTLAGLGLTLGASLFSLLGATPLSAPLGTRFVSAEMVTWGVMAACLPLLVQAGPMWRAVSSQRAVLLAPRGRTRLLIAALAMAAAAALFMSAFYLLAQAPWIIRMVPPAPGEGHWTLVAAIGFGQWSRMFADSFVLATWWGIGAFCASRSPLAALIVVILLVATGLGVPVLAAHLADTSYCQASTGTLCSTIASMQGNPPPLRHFTFALAVWALFTLWYLKPRRIAPPGWLLPGGQSLLAATTVSSASVPLARSAAIEHLLFGGSSIGRLLAQWLLAGLLLLAMLLLLSLQVDPAYVAWVLRAALVVASGIVLALSLAARRRARALWLPAALDRTQVHDLVRNGLLKLALGLTLVAAMFLVAQWYALPWAGGLSLPQAMLALLAANLLWVALVLYRASGWAHLAVSGGVLVLLYFGFAAPLVRNAPGNWGWLIAMLVAAAALLLLARRRWKESDLPGATSAQAS